MAENLENLSTTALALFDLKSFTSVLAFPDGGVEMRSATGVEVFLCFGDGVVELKLSLKKVSEL